MAEAYDLLNCELTPELRDRIISSGGKPNGYPYIARNKPKTIVLTTEDVYGEIFDRGLVPEIKQIYHRLSLDAAQVNEDYTIFDQKFDQTDTAAEGYWRTNCPWNDSKLDDTQIFFVRAWSVLLATNESVADAVDLIQSSAGAVTYTKSTTEHWRELMVNMPASRGIKMDGMAADPTTITQNGIQERESLYVMDHYLRLAPGQNNTIRVNFPGGDTNRPTLTSATDLLIYMEGVYAEEKSM